MTLAGKKRTLLGVLAALAIWPLVQHQLVRRYRVEPWKFAGWAMYARPANKGVMHITGVDRLGIPVPRSRLSRRVRDASHEYERRRSYYGRLVSAEPLARLVFDEHPRVVHVTIAVDDFELSPVTDRFERVSDVYEYDRPGDSATR